MDKLTSQIKKLMEDNLNIDLEVIKNSLNPFG